MKKRSTIVGITALVLLGACSKYGDRTLRWDEQLTLSSGASAIVHREQRIEVHLTSEGASGDRAKIRQGERTVMEYLMSPIHCLADETGGER